jgi:hypothetical protein
MSGKAATTGGKGKGKGGRGEKKQQTSSSSKAGLQFPVGRIARYLRNGKVRACVCVAGKGQERRRKRWSLPLGDFGWKVDGWVVCAIDNPGLYGQTTSSSTTTTKPRLSFFAAAESSSFRIVFPLPSSFCPFWR